MTPTSNPAKKPKPRLTSDVRRLTSEKPRSRKRTSPPRRDRELNWHGAGAVVAGVDEVGRGAWAGPLVAAAVVLDPGYRLRNVRDSKLLTAAARTKLAANITERSQTVGIGVVEIGELNRYGFTWALRQCGLRAIRELSITPDQVLLDGHHDYFAGDVECETIVDGDAKELCIAAASVVAKVHRDELMIKLHQKFPKYGFASNKGYGTQQHQKALAAHGPTEIHRAQWKPIQDLIQQQMPL